MVFLLACAPSSLELFAIFVKLPTTSTVRVGNEVNYRGSATREQHNNIIVVPKSLSESLAPRPTTLETTLRPGGGVLESEISLNNSINEVKLQESFSFSPRTEDGPSIYHPSFLHYTLGTQ